MKITTANISQIPAAKPYTKTWSYKKVLAELKKLGAGNVCLASSEVKYLPSVLADDEQIYGIVSGWNHGDFVVMVATDQRIMYIDKKPLSVYRDDISHIVISGVSLSHAGIGSFITLHTRIKDYSIRTFNSHCAQIFMKYVDTICTKNTGIRTTKEGS